MAIRNKHSKQDMRLKNSVIKQIRKNKACHRALEDRWEKSFYTIETWLKTNNPLLCHGDSLEIIAAHLKEETEALTIKEEQDFNRVV
jgi:hypothetical protein